MVLLNYNTAKVNGLETVQKEGERKFVEVKRNIN